MPGRLDFTVGLDSIDKHVRKLRRFTPKQQRSDLRSSFQASTGPVKTALRRGIRSKIKRLGHLAKSIQSKVKSYPSGNVIVLVGARDRRLGDGENPGKYFHLADAGTKPHEIELTTVRVGNVLVRLDEPYPVQHPGAEPAGVRDQAYRTGVPKVRDAFIGRLQKRLQKRVSS